MRHDHTDDFARGALKMNLLNEVVAQKDLRAEVGQCGDQLLGNCLTAFARDDSEQPMSSRFARAAPRPCSRTEALQSRDAFFEKRAAEPSRLGN